MYKIKNMLTQMTKIKLLLIKLKNIDNENLIISHYINRCNNLFLSINLIVVLREIRRYPRNEKLLILKISFHRLFKKIVRNIINENDDLYI